jgi:type IV fimbrial biogenesis protein FimT
MDTAAYHACVCGIRRRLEDGVTLIELVVTLALLAVLVALAVPSFSDAGLPSQLRAVADKLVGAVQFARSEAIKRDTTVVLCASADGQTCDAGATNWNEGWIVTSGGLPAPLLTEPAAPNGYHVTPAAGSAAISFQSSGLGATPESFTLCRSTPRPGTQERVVTISAVGRPSVQTTTNGVCP